MLLLNEIHEKVMMIDFNIFEADFEGEKAINYIHICLKMFNLVVE